VKILVFDVNETLLDLKAFDRVFADLFGSASVREEWFNLLLQRAFTATLGGAYRDFAALAESALRMTAERHGVAIDVTVVRRVLAGVKELPPHPEVPAALQRLHEAGVPMVALSQSPVATIEAQLEFAGVHHFFARVFSADMVKRYKPDPAPYRMVAAEMPCELNEICMIAAHEWDVEGAMRAGCTAAFVARPGRVLDPAADRPHIVEPDLAAVAARILNDNPGI
jgi:2-haloacid dehalogenase